MKKRIISTVLVICIVAVSCILGHPYFEHVLPSSDAIKELGKETVRIWYTDDALTDFLNIVAVQYSEEEDSSVRIEVTQVSGLEYLEQINTASLSEDVNTPDLFVISNDSLEKAYLAGLASEIADGKENPVIENYSQTALDAVTCRDKIVGYPFYYETSALLYNKTYLEQIARSAVESELGVEQSDDAEESITEEDMTVTDIDAFEGCDDAVKEEALARVDGMIPSTIVDILNFADAYDAPENVESFFKWDVSDIFYNYFFIGDVVSVGGNAGDDKEQISIYNQNAIASLKVYQELNQFFSIEADEVDYESVIQEFQEGRIIFTIATSDAIAKLDAAKAEGNFPYEYGVARIPDINAQLETKGMSVTETIAVNGYSEHKQAANQFAAYLTHMMADELYSMTHKLSADKNVSYDNEWLALYQQEYEDSVPVPKLVETSNFWILLENCFTKVWSGEDANEELKALSEQIMTQLTGENYEEEYIEDPEVELLSRETYEDVESESE